MLILRAPAKLNLTLEVLSKRRDGFHEICSVIQAIDLCDALHFQLGQNIEFNSDQSDWVPEESLVSKAVGLLQEVTGCGKGATIEVKKRIPLMSGLGGDSSDAAATLHGLNELWGLGLSQGTLLELATRLGSDVAFFLYGGTALVEGRGEIITPLPPVSPVWVLLLLPQVPRTLEKTRKLYAEVKAIHYTRGQVTDSLVSWLTGGGEVIPSMLFNVFDNVGLDSYIGLEEYWQQFLKAGAREVHLAGSGPALFAIMQNRDQAEKVYRHMLEQGMESYLVETMSE